MFHEYETDLRQTVLRRKWAREKKPQIFYKNFSNKHFYITKIRKFSRRPTIYKNAFDFFTSDLNELSGLQRGTKKGSARNTRRIFNYIHRV